MAGLRAFGVVWPAPLSSLSPALSLIPPAQSDSGLGAGPDAAAAPGGAEETSVTSAGGQAGPRAHWDVGLLSTHPLPTVGVLTSSPSWRQES